MTDSVVYEQLDQDTSPAATGESSTPLTNASMPGGADGHGAAAATGPHGARESDADLRRLSDVPVELSVEIGRARMTVGETLQLRAGSIVTLERLAGEPVDLLVNGTPIARGEVVVVDEQFGMRVTEIVEDDLLQTPAAESPAGAEQRGAGDPAATNDAATAE
jgi:flagellar motor switch protein FliN/FliY